MVEFKLLHKEARVEHLGLIPFFLSERDPRPVVEQINANYKHGGWHSMRHMKWFLDFTNMRLRYPGDPSMLPLASVDLGEEQVYIYPHAWVVVIQGDMTWDIARID